MVSGKRGEGDFEDGSGTIHLQAGNPIVRESLRALGAWAIAGACLVAGVAAGARAQVGAAEYGARRDSLAARIDSGIVVAFGERTPVSDFGPFYQLPAFHYLTGYDQPDAAFVMVVRRGRGESTVFTTPVNPRMAFYYGFRPDSAAIARSIGLTARPFSALAARYAFGPCRGA